MIHRDTDIVSAFRLLIAEQLGDDTYHVWFSTLEIVFDSNCLEVMVESKFTLERLRKLYQRSLQNLTNKHFGAEIEFKFSQLTKSNDTRVAAEDATSAESLVAVNSAPSNSNASVNAQSGAVKIGQANLVGARSNVRTRNSDIPAKPAPSFGIANSLTNGQVGQSHAVQPSSSEPARDRSTKSQRSVATRKETQRTGQQGREVKSRGRKFANLKTFVRGECNRMGVGSTKLILDDLGSISPFFIHGPNGSGKTHLLEGIWSVVRRYPGRKRVVYLSAEQFTTYFLQALKGGGLPGFRQKYRGVDCLIIDDVQFFAGKQATIVELLHTIDSNLREGGQLVLAADRPISELHQLGGELTARLSSGLSCELAELDLQTRKEILRGLALKRRFEISDEHLSELAMMSPGDGRQLSGVVNRLWVTSQVKDQPVDTKMIREVVSELFTSNKSVVRLMDIERVVCGQFGIDSDLLKSDNRTRNVSHPRMLAMWLARKYTRAALAEISEFFGRRSHSTVVSAQNKVEAWVSDGAKVQMSQSACDVRDVVRQLERDLAVG